MFLSKKAFILAGITLCGSACAYSQTVISVQDGAWSDPATWSGGSVPQNSDLVALNHNIFIDPGEVSLSTITVNGRLTLNSGATLNILGDGNSSQPDLRVTGTLVTEDLSSLNGSSTQNAVFESGSIYIHRQGPLGYVPLATWSAGSTFQISGFTTSGYINIAHSDGWKQAFGNVVYDCPMQTIFVVDLNGYLRNIAGDFVIRNTNGRTLRLSTSQNSVFVINGNFIVEGNSEVWLSTTSVNCRLNIGGDFRYLSTSTGPSYLTTRGTTLVSVTGNWLMNSSGPLRTASSAADSLGSRQVTMQVSGDFSILNGSIIAPPAGRGLGTIQFTGSGIQRVTTSTAGSSFLGNMAFVIDGQSSVDLGQSVLSSDAGSLTVAGRLRLGATHPQGAIQLARQGNIHIPGPRSFLASSSIEYNGLSPQWVGDGHPISTSLIANNPGTLTLVRDVRVGGRLQCLSGIVQTGPYVLSVDGDVEMDALSGSVKGIITLTGDADQQVSANGKHLEHLKITKQPGTRVSITSPLVIDKHIQIHSVNTTLESNGNLHLSSVSDDPNGTAGIGPLPTGATIEGDVNINRYMNGEGRIYRYISSPVSNATVASLIDDVPVTGSFDDPSIGPGIVSRAPSLFYYDQSNGDLAKGWKAFPTVGSAASNALIPGLGYAIFVREGSQATTLDFTGRVNQGDLPLPLAFTGNGQAGNGWNLVGNPYPSSIDWDIDGPGGWSKSNVSPVISIRDNGGGGIFHYWDGDNSYDDIPNGHIASCQSFWVRAVGPDPELIIREGVKVPEAASFFRAPTSTVPSFVLSISGNGLKDKVFYKVRRRSKEKAYVWQAPKLFNDKLNIFARSANQSLAIISRPTLPCDSTLALGIIVPESGEYEFALDARADLQNYDYTLIDSVENREYELVRNQPVGLKLATLSNMEEGRYFIRFRAKIITDSLRISYKQLLCDRTDLEIKIQASQSGVRYVIVGPQDAMIGNPVLSMGGDLHLTLAGEYLNVGVNHFRIRAFNSCESVELSARIAVTLTEPTFVQAWVQYDCATGLATYSAYSDGPETVFLWFNARTPLDTLSQSSHWIGVDERSNQYNVIGILPSGCVTDTALVHRLPDKLVPVKVTVDSDGALLSSYESGNTWFVDGLELSEKSNRILAHQDGLYVVRVDVNKCVTMDSLAYSGSKTETPEFTVYPNPTDNYTTITPVGGHELPPYVQVWSQSGSQVASLPVERFAGKSRQGRIRISTLANGVYIIVIQSGTGNRAIRIVKDD